jgi:hypothetical protein
MAVEAVDWLEMSCYGVVFIVGNNRKSVVQAVVVNMEDEVSSVLFSRQILPFFKHVGWWHWHSVNEHDSREMDIPATKLQRISAIKLGI